MVVRRAKRLACSSNRQPVCVDVGFVRMAIEHNSKLVPVVVLGEVSALQNPIDLPELQRWTYKNLGFPVPYWVVGRWGVSPFPKRVGLKFIIGEPLSPRPHVPGTMVCIQHVCSLDETQFLPLPMCMTRNVIRARFGGQASMLSPCAVSLWL